MNEYPRQLSHLAFGLLIAAFIYFTDTQTAISVMAVVVILGIAIADAISRGYHVPLFSWIIGRLERDSVFPGMGSMVFFIAALFCLIIFGSQITVASMIVLSVLDSVSTAVGLRFGKTKIYGKKTLEGMLAGFVAASVALAIYSLVPLALPLGALSIIVASGAAAITELISPVDDNITIPVVVCIVLFFIV